MSLLIPAPKLLLDENVHLSLYKYLNSKGVDVKLVPKSASDEQVAAISKNEQRVLVTNDEDFGSYSPEGIFAMVWLRIPQGDSQSLIGIFEKLLKSKIIFSSKLIVLSSTGWVELPLGEDD